MRPALIDSMSWEMAEVYGAITDQILINIARRFPYYDAQSFPRSTLTYQAGMLAQMGQVNAETMNIIRRNLKGCDKYLAASLEQVIIDSVAHETPDLWKAVKKGIFMPPTTPVLSPNQYRAYSLYYRQAADKLNLVNTVMLESTQQAYRATVADIVNRVQRTQTALDIGAGEVVTGVSAWNSATAHAINRMKQGGIIGFIDHAGHRWSAEAYVAMDIRTTMFNTGRAAVWETNQDFGNDLYQVSYHNGARPLCYPWQNKVISSTDTARTVTDLDGNEIEVIAQSATSYGEAAGLFGINCRHYPTPFIPGVSVIRGQPQDKEENDRVYEESQQQRGLERKIREERRDLLMLREQGAPDDLIKAQKAKIRQTDDDIDEFCARTGRTRRQNREAVYTRREFPSSKTYDVALFEQTQRDMMEQYYKSGGVQQTFTFGQMVPKVPIIPPTPPAPPAPPAPVAPAPVVPQNVAPQATPATPNALQSRSESGEKLIKRLEAQKIKRRPVQRYTVQPTEEEIIKKIAGADKTKGSCSSCAFAYAGNKNGLDVRDFRGGMSQYAFSSVPNIRAVLKFDGVVGTEVTGGNDFTIAHKLLKNVQDGKEYYFSAGKHAAVVRKSATGVEYLELQSGWREHTWYELTDAELKRRFGCQRSHTVYGMKYECTDVIIDIDSLRGNRDFEEMLEFINTAPGEQMKGVGGGEK